MDTADLKLLLRVAKLGSFSAAAREADVDPSSVSRTIANLERELGARLFQRSTRKLTITPSGERFLSRIESVLEEISTAHNDLRGETEAPSGRLRVTASISFTEFWIRPRLKSFLDAHPSVSLELFNDDAPLDMISKGIHLAFRHGELEDSQLIARRFRTVEYWLVSAPSVQGIVRSPEELQNQPTIGLALRGFRDGWTFEAASTGSTVEVPIHPRLTVSSPFAALGAVKDGLGYGIFADWMVEELVSEGELRRRLPDWQAFPAGKRTTAIWAITPSRAFTPASVTAFLSHMHPR